MVIPNIAHFVFGLREQDEPMHFLHYVAVESARRVLEPDAIYFHYCYEPWGPWWDRIASHVTPLPVMMVPEVTGADYSSGLVPESYLYAHHADFIRLDALAAYGGVYADIDTIFVRRPPNGLYSKQFVIGREGPVTSQLTGEVSPSLCNALMMAEPSSSFAVEWRAKMASALDGTWSGHSGTLAHRLSVDMPAHVHVESEATFFPFPADAAGLYGLLLDDRPLPETTVSVHLWAHLWWDRRRRDFTPVHADWCSPSTLRRASTTLAALARPYIPKRSATKRTAIDRGTDRPWLYLSPDEDSGYGTAARRAMQGLESTGLEVAWAPMIPSPRWRLGYAVPRAYTPVDTERRPDDVVVVHHVPEYYPLVRAHCGAAFMVGHTAWETENPPAHWRECLDVPDLLVVPSKFSAQALIASGTDTPVEVVPHALSVAEPAALDPGWGIDDERFVYYTIADWTTRKGIDATVEAYLRAFSGDDPVVLVVKTSRAAGYGSFVPRSAPIGPGSAALALARIVGRHKAPAEIKLVVTNVPERQIAALHRRGDCFVSLCRGEGWGVGAFDAAAAGKPVVTTGWGGHLDYLGDYPFLVDFDLVPEHDPREGLSVHPEQRWAEPDVDHAAAILREIYRYRGDACDAVAATAVDIRERFSQRNVGIAFRAAVAKHMKGMAVAPRRTSRIL